MREKWTVEWSVEESKTRICLHFLGGTTTDQGKGENVTSVYNEDDPTFEMDKNYG